jgi:thiol-disulfide isomerase/thioredoxin
VEILCLNNILNILYKGKFKSIKWRRINSPPKKLQIHKMEFNRNHALKAFIFLCFIYTLLSTYGQLHDKFTLQGVCNIQNGFVHLEPIDSIYYPSQTSSFTTKLSNGIFNFEAPFKYPLAYRLFVMESNSVVYHSDLFFVNKGLQTIIVNTKELGSLPEINNTTMQELGVNYFHSFKKYYLNVEKYNLKRDSLKKTYNYKLPIKVDSELANELKILSNQEDSILLFYTKKHPNSYVALWKVVDKVTGGYSVIYDSIISNFSDNIKKTYTGKVLTNKMKSAKVAKIGNIYPTLTLFDSIQNINLKATNLNNKFTLIDFWFSDCAPCKAQFQELKRLYENYSIKGFNIIGISVDQQEDIAKWKKTINTYGLTWKQYLDTNQNESRKLSILSFPTNYLLDEKGIIIAKNISLADLSEFLKDNIK